MFTCIILSEFWERYVLVRTGIKLSHEAIFFLNSGERLFCSFLKQVRSGKIHIAVIYKMSIFVFSHIEWWVKDLH